MKNWEPLVLGPELAIDCITRSAADVAAQRAFQVGFLQSIGIFKHSVARHCERRAQRTSM